MSDLAKWNELLAASKDALKEMMDINGDYPAEELAVEIRLAKAIAAIEPQSQTAKE